MPDTDSSLNDAIAEALAVGKADPNINEACTCEWIVNPLLQAAGYGLYDIQPQAMDSAGKVPDFTILPNTEQAWFVEAKAWNVALNDQHAQQALIYAFANSRRWVVLTNGREWRLYDNSIQGQHLRQKQVASAMLDDVDRAAEFLRAIGRESMTGGAVERYAANAQLSAVLEKELSNPSGDIIKAIWSRLRTRPGLAGITKEQVAGYFAKPPHESVPAGPRQETTQEDSAKLKLDASPLSEQDTIVVPARRDGFLRVFIGENAWWAIRIRKERIPHIRYIAAYQVKPISAITHVAEVERIEPYGDSGKYKLFFKGPAQEIGPLRPGPEMKTGFLQSPRITTYAKLSKATTLDEVF